MAKTQIQCKNLIKMLPLGALICGSAAWAQTPPAEVQVVRLEELEVTADAVSALTQAPTDSKLEALQPQSAIGINYIANNMAPTADYATIASLTPSVVNVETNGPGLSEAKHTTIRGIDDGGYNVTYDGIPFGDYNTFTHHTTSYFPAKLIGQVVVDRGPGTASTIGNATFGGTMALLSKDPRSEGGFIPTFSLGSYGTVLQHYEGNTGLLESLNNASVIASFQHMKTDGFRSNADMARDTYYLKYLQPIGKNTVITLNGSYNKISFGNPGTVTQAQINTFGRDFGLKDDTTANKLDVLNRKYNYQDKTADFEYIGVTSDLGGGWKVDNKLYTYSYDNQSHEKAKAGTGTAASQMLGRLKTNEYRTYGDSFLVSNENDTGVFKTGLWYDTSKNHRNLFGVNYDTTGAGAIDQSSSALFKAVAPGGNPATAFGQPYYNYLYHLVDDITTYQPFAEYTWKATEQLDVNGGVKYMSFTRDFNADVNQTSGRQALIAKRTDEETMFSLASNYRVTKTWSTYAQVAQGFQAPSEANSFYVNNANLGKIDIKPQTSMNYQVGTVYKTDRLNADADVYYVDFENYAYNGPTDANGDPSYYGIAKGAYYQGVETQATYLLGAGFSAYANGSINQAKFKESKMKVPTVAEGTAVLGLIYEKNGLFGSFTEKYVGPWTVYDTVTNPDVAGIGATRAQKSDDFWLADLSLGYGRKFDRGFIKSYKIRLQVGNLFDNKVQVLDTIGASAVPATVLTTDAFNVLPGRNYSVTFALQF